MNLLFIVLLGLCVPSLVLGRKGFGDTDQEWGTYEIRNESSLFYWLYYTTADVDDVTERPLVIWLQGGPGASSTGFGNFGEIGPLDADLNPRNSTWVKDVNVLFVDNPVGTGYSHVDGTYFANSNREIADDFLVFLKSFFAEYEQFTKTSLYILCESYGGKMTAEIALVLHQAIEAGEIACNFKGIGLGDSWISPIDSVLTWAPYLLQLGAIDEDIYNRVQAKALETKQALDEERYYDATALWSETEYLITFLTYGIDFYNVLTKISSESKFRRSLLKDALDDKIYDLMNGPVKEALNVSVNWGAQSGIVFNVLEGDFMKPVTDIVEQVLNTTDLKVAVYNGQLDLIVDTPGTVKWVNALKFDGKAEWDAAPRDGFSVNGVYEGYVKKAGNFAFYWIDRSGHMVPTDNPAAMDYILRELTDNYSP